MNRPSGRVPAAAVSRSSRPRSRTTQTGAGTERGLVANQRNGQVPATTEPHEDDRSLLRDRPENARRAIGALLPVESMAPRRSDVGDGEDGRDDGYQCQQSRWKPRDGQAHGEIQGELRFQVVADPLRWVREVQIQEKQESCGSERHPLARAEPAAVTRPTSPSGISTSRQPGNDWPRICVRRSRTICGNRSSRCAAK